MSVTHIALWLLWHSVSSILGSGLGPLGMWFGLGTSSSSGCCSPIWGSLRSLATVTPPERLSGSDFTSSGIPVTRCREEWWCGPGKYSQQNSMYCIEHTFVPVFKEKNKNVITTVQTICDKKYAVSPKSASSKQAK